jgi:hypothetical protein
MAGPTASNRHAGDKLERLSPRDIHEGCAESVSIARCTGTRRAVRHEAQRRRPGGINPGVRFLMMMALFVPPIASQQEGAPGRLGAASLSAAGPRSQGAPRPSSGAPSASFCDVLKVIVDDQPRAFQSIQGGKSAVENWMEPSALLWSGNFSKVNIPGLSCRIYRDVTEGTTLVQCSRGVAGTSLATRAFSDTVGNVKSCALTKGWTFAERGVNLARTFSARDRTTEIHVSTPRIDTMPGIYRIVLRVQDAPR